MVAKEVVDGSAQLTSRQRSVLEMIVEGLRTHGVAPTFREIRDRLGLRSIGAVQDHVRALERKGVVQRHGRKARGLSIVGTAHPAFVPIVGTVPAGVPFEAVEATEGYLSVPVGNSTGTLFALRVRGDSMKDAAIVDGDLVIVEKTTHVKHADVVVALIDGDATVKHLDLRGDVPALRSANPEYAPISLANENWQILGRVVGLWRDRLPIVPAQSARTGCGS